MVRQRTLAASDFAAIERRRGEHNQLGFALQLCAFRYPGRLLRAGDTIPKPALSLVTEQLRVSSDALTSYATRHQTRREHLDALRDGFGFRNVCARVWSRSLAAANRFGNDPCLRSRRSIDG